MGINENTYTNETIRLVTAQKEACWINPYKLPFETVDALCQLIVPDAAIADAEKRLQRFAPFLCKCFPETRATEGRIDSPLKDLPLLQKELEKAYHCSIPGKLLLKMDSHLAIAGSVKARGGIYEVLKHAENLALTHGILSPGDNYEKLAESSAKAFFGNFTVQVGSTGNLGLSIGIMSAAIGFKVKVHMSADAKPWKKELLRSKGIEVCEYEDDYSHAVAEGRMNSEKDPNSYFVDDEKSVDLFIGYAVAARHLQKQLTDRGIVVDREHPLIVYLPAGVGSAPGGISYGLKRIYKDNVHCFFTEPTACPSVLLGIATQTFEKANVHNWGISGNTLADGLACAQPSGFVTRIMTNLVSGAFTVADRALYDYMRQLYYSENIKVEPSSCAAFQGPCRLLSDNASKEYCRKNHLNAAALNNATQVVWATGGKLVPDHIYEEYLNTYIKD